ncbi:hypothetical protein JCM21900_006730 [Sporobolomyces salmonicolor]
MSDVQALANYCLPAFSALDNSLGQNPCQISRILIDVCDSNQADNAWYPLDALVVSQGQLRYPPPNQHQASSCVCSMGVYNLVQACGACQQPTPINTTLWTDWVSNCTMSNINQGHVFPYYIPPATVLPDWATVNNANGALSVGEAFRHISANSSQWPFNPDSYSLTTSTPSSTAYTEAAASESVGTLAPNASNDSDSGSSSKNTIIGVAVPVVVVGALLAAALAYFRRKKRKLRQRGHRLGSDQHLPEPAFVAEGSSAASSSTFPVMEEHSKDSHVSLFLPSETVITRGSRSRSSFTTNSVSTRSFAAGPRGPRRDLYNPRASSLWTPSNGYDSRSSTGYTYEDGSDDDDLYSREEDDDSISPFSDIHRPARTVTATRNNIHTPSSFRHSRSTFYSSNASESVLSHGDGADAQSLLTTSSRAAPSSSGATYGGVHDLDDGDETEDDDVSLQSRR